MRLEKRSKKGKGTTTVIREMLYLGYTTVFYTGMFKGSNDHCIYTIDDRWYSERFPACRDLVPRVIEDINRALLKSLQCDLYMAHMLGFGVRMNESRGVVCYCRYSNLRRHRRAPSLQSYSIIHHLKTSRKHDAADNSVHVPCWTFSCTSTTPTVVMMNDGTRVVVYTLTSSSGVSALMSYT